MSKSILAVIIGTIITAIAAITTFTGQVTGKQGPKQIITEGLSNKSTFSTQIDNFKENNEGLTKIYSRAISDYITEVSKQHLISFDTLFIGKRNNGQPDDFPNITLPGKIKNIKIRLVDPKIGKRLQEEKRSRVYINLIGWVYKEKAEFLFVTFSNGFEHKFDLHIHYKYNLDLKEFHLVKSRVEIFSKRQAVYGHPAGQDLFFSIQ